MKKYLIILLIFQIAIAGVAGAATNDFTADGDVIVDEVAFNSATVDMLIMNGSEAESWGFSGGTFTVTNPGTYFRVGTASSTVTAIKAMSGSSNVACTLNSTPGTSYLDLPTTAGTYTIVPLTITDCNSLCPTVSHAATYNSFPTCGAASCSTGYTLSGSSCIAVPVSSGGGGGGPIVNPVPVTTNTDTQETYTTTADGTVVSTETTVERDETTNAVLSETVVADIEVAGNSTEAQTVSIETTKSSMVKSVSVQLPAVVLNDISAANNSSKVSVSIESREATEKQKTFTAREDKFLVGYDIFDIKVNSGATVVKDFSSPVTLKFDIGSVEYKNQDLKVFFFNDETGKWELAGNGGTRDGDKLIVNVNHLTVYAIMFWIASAAQAEILDDRALQMQQIYSEANVVFTSGSNLDAIIFHNAKPKDSAAQAAGMEKYTNPIVDGINGLALSQIYAINNFIVYGTQSTQVLGAGERAGVVNSYKKAFDKVPRTEEEWKDCIAIGNGRWPGETSPTAESKAKAEFKKVYLREPNMAQPNDNAAVTVISYGLRPDNRNMESETDAIKIFKGIFKYNPTNALDWDIVRAIAYSGAIR